MSRLEVIQFNNYYLDKHTHTHTHTRPTAYCVAQTTKEIDSKLFEYVSQRELLV